MGPRACSFVVFVSLMLIISQDSVQAMCSLLPGGLEAYFSASTAVFRGRATAVDAAIPRATLPETTFDVEEIWKGTPQAVMRVQSSHSDTEGFVFKVGTTYVVFAYGEPLFTSVCMQTSQVDSDDNTILKWLAMKPSQRPSNKALELIPR